MTSRCTSGIIVLIRKVELKEGFRLTHCFFVSDLHGSINRYRTLFSLIEEETPDGIFIGGDILPSGMAALASADSPPGDFLGGFFTTELIRLKDKLAEKYPRIFIILGNDDGRFEETTMLDPTSPGIWEYIHNRRIDFGKFIVYGYSYVPPTPFQLKDWERYDVSRYVDPGCISPEEGRRSVPVSEDEKKYTTIEIDLKSLVKRDDPGKAILLFHTPPYQTKLDRAALDEIMVDHVPLDVNVGSIAVRRFIEARQPLVTLHGHVHESARLTGSWKDRISKTYCFSAAHDGPELALVRFDPECPWDAQRELIRV